MLLAVDLHEDFIDIEGITIAAMISLQATSIDSTELYSPQSDRFSSHDDASLGQEIFNVAMAQIEAVVEPDGVGDYIGRESMSFVGVHRQIISFQ